MNATAVPKSPAPNWLEGVTLTVIFVGLPTFAGTALLLKLVFGHEIVGEPYGAAIFVALTSLFSAVVARALVPKFPRFFRNGYEPAFFDASLSFGEKLAQWRAQPKTSLQLVTTVTMLSLLAVAAASVG